jgi:hypothetical protein
MPIASLSVQQIVAVIRQEMTAKVGAPSVAALGPGIHKDKAKRTTPKQRKDSGLSALIGQRLTSLSHDDPERGRKAFRIFLESVLINELGDAMVNDPEFYELIDKVHCQMEESPQIAAAMKEAVALLLSGSQSVVGARP